MKGAIITIDANDHMHVGDLKWDGAIVMVAPLQFGDLQILHPNGYKILIERKTPNDLLQSMKDGRLINQVVGMVDGADFAYLVVSGFFFQRLNGEVAHFESERSHTDISGWQWHSLQGQLASIQQLGCTIWYEPDYHEAVRLIMNRSYGNVKIKARREPYIFSETENVLMALPGIGSKKATEIMGKFPTVGYAIEWLSKPGEYEPRIPGIGTGIKQKINEFLGGEMELKL